MNKSSTDELRAASQVRCNIAEDGTKSWWRQDGQLHRDDGPAIEYADGSKEWHRDGKRHRDDGPALEQADGSKAWWDDGKLHRDDGPAIERADGTKVWYRDGKRHRDDGPAYEGVDGKKEWWQNGEQLTPDQVSQIEATVLAKDVAVLPTIKLTKRTPKPKP